MNSPRVAGDLARVWQQGVRRARRLDERTHGWLRLITGAAREALKPNSAILAAAIAYFVALFMVLYIMLPHGSSTWREVIPGAIGAGLLCCLAKKAFLLFVSTYISISNLVYGSVAAIVAFLLWAYLSGLIFLFGAFLSVSYYQLKQQPEAAGQLHQPDTRTGGDNV